MQTFALVEYRVLSDTIVNASDSTIDAVSESYDAWKANLDQYAKNTFDSMVTATTRNHPEITDLALVMEE